MATARDKANFTLKKLTSFDDFGERFLDFLTDEFRELATRTFGVDGVFAEKIAVAGTAPDVITLTQGLDEFEATDGSGNLIGMASAGSEDAGAGQIKSIPIENTAAKTYYVSLQATTIPRGISINPRTGLPEFTKLVTAIGVKAAPNSVVDNGGTLTMVIDSVCEATHSHAGRTALVYLTNPDRNATAEGTAIELATVSWNGVNNRITTTGVFGQTTVDTLASRYTVVLLGPTVRYVDTSALVGHCYLASIVGVGAGGTPGAGDVSNQKLIDQTLSTIIDYPGGPNWADGTTNPATTIVNQITKIITDLTSTSGQYGTGKINAKALPFWQDATQVPAGHLQATLDAIINDLTDQTGGGGSDRIGSGAMANTFNDGVGLGDASIWSQINTIIGAYASEAGAASGAHKIGSAALTTWADGSAAPGAESIHFQLNNIVFQLARTVAADSGARLLGIENSTATLATGATIGGGPLRSFLETLITVLGNTSGSAQIGALAYGGLPSGSVQDQLRDLEDNKGGLGSANVWLANNEFQTFLELGTGLDSATPALAESARIRTGPTGAAVRTLLWESSISGVVPKFRLYQFGTQGFHITYNALWDEDTDTWAKDQAGSTASKYTFEGFRFGIAFRDNTSGATWADGAWDRDTEITHNAGGTTGTEVNLDDGRLRVIGATATSNGSNPTAGTAPLSNTLYAKNIPKGWGRLYTQAVTPLIDDGFNFNTAAYAGANLDIAITFHISMSSGLAVVPMVVGLNAVGADFHMAQVHSDGINGFSFRPYRETLDRIDSGGNTSTDVKMVAYGNNGINEEWGWTLMARDT